MTKRTLFKYLVFLIISTVLSDLFYGISLGCAFGSLQSMGCGSLLSVLAVPFNILFSVKEFLVLGPFNYDWLFLTPEIFVLILLIEKLVRFFRENKIGIAPEEETK